MTGSFFVRIFTKVLYSLCFSIIKIRIMKKLLVFSLFISLKALGQAKIEAVVGASESATAISATNKNPNGYGIGVYALSQSGYGVYGKTYGNNGVGVFGYGENGSGTGVYGYADFGIGVRGQGAEAGGSFSSGSGKALITSGGLRFGGNNVGTLASGKILKSINANGDAEWSNLVPYFYGGSENTYMLGLENESITTSNPTIYGLTNTSGSAIGAITGIAHHANPSFHVSGIKGISRSNTTYGYGVSGEHYGLGAGVYGNSDSGTGVFGYSIHNYGVVGDSKGVIGVWGNCDNNYGVFGTTNSGLGVYGSSSGTGTAGYFSSFSGYALITGSGRVGIGVSTPNNILDVNGRVRIRHTNNSSGIWMSNSTNGLSDADGAFYGMKTDTETGIYIGNLWRFWVNSAGNGYLNGNLIQTSDKRLKKDFSPLNNSLTDISRLSGYHYKWIEESRSKELQTGLIAQEVQKIFPELVQTDEKGFLSVNYIGLVPHLIEAVKELRNENNALKNKSQSLESRLDKIEALLTAHR